MQIALGFFGNNDQRWPLNDGAAIALARLSHLDDQGYLVEQSIARHLSGYSRWSHACGVTAYQARSAFDA